jgi:UDP-N-acetyl-D-glucosamine dehydrogenase
MRESPSAELIELLTAKGATVEYSDPHVPVFKKMRRYSFNLESVALTASTIAGYDLVLLATDHDAFDYELIRANATLLVDTRGRFPGGTANVVNA